MALRDYQTQLLKHVLSELSASARARVMLQLPTGGGKTRIAGELLSNWLRDGRKAVWLTHRKELAAQTEGMLHEDDVSATKDINWTLGTTSPAIPNGVVILMAQTVSRRTARAGPGTTPRTMTAASSLRSDIATHHFTLRHMLEGAFTLFAAAQSV